MPILHNKYHTNVISLKLTLLNEIRVVITNCLLALDEFYIAGNFYTSSLWVLYNN